MNKIEFNFSLAKQSRKQNKLTLVDVSSETGYSKSIISDWELGKKRPKLDQIITLAKIYSIFPQKLYKIGLYQQSNIQANELKIGLQCDFSSDIMNFNMLGNNIKLIKNYLNEINVIYYIKNTHNQYISYSKEFLKLAQRDIIDLKKNITDYNIFFDNIAKKVEKEDLFLLKAGRSITYTDLIIGQKTRTGEYCKKIIFNADNIPIAMVCTIKDITEYKETKELHDILSNQFNKEGLVLEQVYPYHKYYINSIAAIKNFGNYKQKPNNFWKWIRFIHPDHLELKIKLARHIPVSIPHRYKTISLDGKIKWIEQRITLKRLKSGAIIRLGYQADITPFMNYREQKIITRLQNKSLKKYLLNFKETSITRNIQKYNEPFLKEELKKMKYKS